MSSAVGHVRLALQDAECVMEAQQALRFVVDSVASEHEAAERARLQARCKRLLARAEGAERRVSALEVQRQRFSEQASRLTAAFRGELADLEARRRRSEEREGFIHRLESRCGRQQQRIRSLRRGLLRLWSQRFPTPPPEVATDGEGRLVGADAVLSRLSDVSFRRLLGLLDDRDRAAFAISSPLVCERIRAVQSGTPLDAASRRESPPLDATEGYVSYRTPVRRQRRHSFALGAANLPGSAERASPGLPARLGVAQEGSGGRERGSSFAGGMARGLRSFSRGSGAGADPVSQLRPAEMKEVLRMRKDVEAARQREARLREEKEDLVARVEALGQARQLLVEQLHKAQGEAGAAGRQASASQEVATFLDQRVRELEAEAEEARAQAQGAREEARAAQERLHAAESEHAHASEEHQMEVEQEQEVVAAQEQEINQLQEELATARQQWKREKRVLVNEVRTLRGKLQEAGAGNGAEVED